MQDLDVKDTVADEVDMRDLVDSLGFLTRLAQVPTNCSSRISAMTARVRASSRP